MCIVKLRLLYLVPSLNFCEIFITVVLCSLLFFFWSLYILAFLLQPLTFGKAFGLIWTSVCFTVAAFALHIRLTKCLD